MHELSVCRSLLSQVEGVAQQHGGTHVTRVVVQVGPLSGVVPLLLREAFAIAKAGTIAAEATLEIEETAMRVRCGDCGAESEVMPNRLVCAACGNWQTQLISGDELILARVELGGRSGD